MQRNTKRIIGKGVVCLLCFLLGGVATLGITWHLLGQDGRTLLQAHQLIDKRFGGEYDPAENLSATWETMVDSRGDRWSYYLDPEESKIYLCKRTGEMDGGKVILQYLPHERIGQYFEAAQP